MKATFYQHNSLILWSLLRLNNIQIKPESLRCGWLIYFMILLLLCCNKSRTEAFLQQDNAIFTTQTTVHIVYSVSGDSIMNRKLWPTDLLDLKPCF